MNNPVSPTFRSATASDVDAIVALVESSYRGDSGRRGWTTESDLLDGRRTDAEAVVELLDRSDSVLLLAESGGRLLASCHIERQGDSGYFGMFAVDPLQQGQGLGKLVLAQGEHVAREQWGCATMRMTVIEQRGELIAWYERRGYQRNGEFAPFPYGNERFGIPLRDDLRFVVLVKRFASDAA